jgi:hypothetical protein
LRVPFANNSPFVALDVPTLDPSGRDVLVVLVKATFDVRDDGRLRRSGTPSDIRMGDELYNPDRLDGSARYPSDLGVSKVGTDVVVVGEAIAPRPVDHVDVAIAVGARTVPLRVHGPRVFYRGIGGIRVSPASPFERMPIVYELAYGGASNDYTVVEHRNPAGVGVARHASDLVDQPAPQVEHPARPHAVPSDDHEPAGCGSIMMYWSPRKDFAGTFDDRWHRERAPLQPLDFSPRCNNVAHPSLWFEDGVAAGTMIGVAGMSEQPVTFALPALEVEIRVRYEVSGSRTVMPAVDLLLIEPEPRRVELVARAAFPLGRGHDVLRDAVVEARRRA